MDALHYWLFGACFTLIGACFAWQWRHRDDCERKRIADAAEFAKLDTEMTRVKADIGDHKSGLRGGLHDLREMVSPIVVRAQLEEERRESHR